MVAEWVVFGGGITLTMGALAVTALRANKESQFLYANARIVSRSVLTKEKLKPFSELRTLPDLVNNLSNTDYHHFLEPIDKNKISEFNMALEQSFVDSMLKLRDISPKKFQVVYDSYKLLFESKIIKTFFRSRFSGVKIAKNLIEPIGYINPGLIEHLHETKTVADIKLVLRNTEYKDLFERGYDRIEEFDLAIEHLVMQRIIASLKTVKVYDTKIVLSLFEKRRTIRNILTLIKFKIRGTKPEDQEQYIHIEGMDVGALVSAKDVSELASLFDNTEYNDAMNKALEDFKKSGNYYSFEKELLSYFLDYLKDNQLAHSIGPYPIISYLMQKEFEQKNLLIIAKGIVSGEDPKRIMEMII